MGRDAPMGARGMLMEWPAGAKKSPAAGAPILSRISSWKGAATMRFSFQFGALIAEPSPESFHLLVNKLNASVERPAGLRVVGGHWSIGARSECIEPCRRYAVL